MTKYLLGLAAIASTAALATPASAAAVLYCSSGPGIDLVNDGCISGTASSYPGGGDGIYQNAGGGDPLAAVQAAITAATGVAPVGLALYGKSDENAGLFNLTGLSGQSGTWDVLDNSILIKYVTVKAANSFALYELPGAGANLGSFSTAGILNNGGNQPDVSHISFWQASVTQSAVPEPAAWLTMLLGFGLIGGMLRNRKWFSTRALA